MNKESEMQIRLMKAMQANIRKDEKLPRYACSSVGSCRSANWRTSDARTF